VIFISAFGGQAQQCLELCCARDEVYGNKTIEVVNKVTHRRKTPFYEIRMPPRQKQSRFSAGWKSQCKNVKLTFFRTAGKKRRA
jgi:hypothetical protein